MIEKGKESDASLTSFTGLYSDAQNSVQMPVGGDSKVDEERVWVRPPSALQSEERILGTWAFLSEK